MVPPLRRFSSIAYGVHVDPVKPGKPQTILVLGSDRRFVDIKQDNPARSDTMMLVRLDPSKEATAVMNIPRDLKVPIQVPGGGIDTTKINAAYAYGDSPERGA